MCVVERLCGSSEEREAVRLGGGIPLLLNILSRNDTTDSTDNEGCDKVTYDSYVSIIGILVKDTTVCIIAVVYNNYYA